MMRADSFSFPLGDAAITVFRSGGFRASPGELMVVPESDQTLALDEILNKPATFPCWSIHIALGKASVLVDPGRFDGPLDDPWLLPAAETPPDLIKQLAAAGIDAASITHVIITHPHDDHYGAALCGEGADLAPCFANARHYLSRADWESADFRESFADPESSERTILGRLYDWGLLHLVDGAETVVDGVDILPAPGETPGHQIVHIYSQGQTLYCLGDLYHHPLEVEHPDWTANWADAETASLSRAMLAERALAEDAMLIATHIPTLGRLVRTSTGVEWQTVEAFLPISYQEVPGPQSAWH